MKIAATEIPTSTSRFLFPFFGFEPLQFEALERRIGERVIGRSFLRPKKSTSISCSQERT